MANRNLSSRLLRTSWMCAAGLYFIVSSAVMCLPANGADDAFENEASWQQPTKPELTQLLRQSLEQLGIAQEKINEAAEQFSTALENQDFDPLDSFVATARTYSPLVEQLATLTSEDLQEAGARVAPDHPAHLNLTPLPKVLQASVRTWLGRELVRARLYDEALPAFRQVETVNSADPAATLFFRGACYHALLQKKEALVDLERLLENEKACPIRFTRTAQLMVADISPLKEDSLDEISRLMTDVTRRLDLGRADEDVRDQEQKIIDKLSKLIDKIEEQQQQQQQQQQQSAQGQGNSQGGQSSPMNDSQAAGGSGAGDVDRKKIEDRDGWGKLPPAERKEALQQISRDLPTHYREAIEAYFRKLATDGS